jgi:hypothetical protein
VPWCWAGFAIGYDGVELEYGDLKTALCFASWVSVGPGGDHSILGSCELSGSASVEDVTGRA